MSGDSGLDAVYGAKTPEESRALYQAWAADYDADNLKKGYRLAGIAAALLARYLPRGEGPVLDAGCGTGLIGEALAIFGYQDIEGLDISERMLEGARARSVYQKLGLQVLGETIAEPSDRFAAATCFGSFGPGHAPPESLDELVRVVRPGGPVIFNVIEATYEEQGFTAKMAALSAAGTWRERERTPPFTPYLLAEPELFARAFVFEVL